MTEEQSEDVYSPDGEFWGTGELPPRPDHSGNGNGNGHVELAVRGGKVRPKPDPMVGVELGVPQSLPFATFEEYAAGRPLAPNNALISVDRLIEMRQKDGQARALDRLIRLPIITAMKDAEWIAPENLEDRKREKEEKAKEEGEEAEEEGRPTDAGTAPEVEYANLMWTLPPQMGGMSVTRTKFMRQVLRGIIEGFSVFEEVREVPTEGPLKGKIVLRKMAHRDSRTIRFLTDDHGGFDGVQQTASARGTTVQKIIEADKCWYWAANEEENSFYGISFFESAWHHWDNKRKLYYISHIAAQMAATKGRIGVIPPSATTGEVNAFKKMLAEFGFNTAGTMKEGWAIEWADMNSQFDFLKLIDHQNQQMAKSVSAKFLEDVDRQVLIENGEGDPSADFFLMLIESVMDEIAENLTHYHMPKYIDWNFGSKLYPVFTFGVLSDTTKNVIKELFTVIATAQATQWTPEFIREMEKKLADQLGLDIDYKAVEKREEQEKEEQAAFQQQYLASKGGPGDQDEEGGPTGQGKPFNEDAAIAAASAGNPAEPEMERLITRLTNRLLSRR
jgi:hypothetical protein